MPISLSLRPLRACPLYLWLLFCALVTSPRTVWAQDPSPTPSGPIQMALSSPFASTPKPLVVLERPGRWVPIAVTLNNRGDAVSGEVRLRLLSSGGFDTTPNDFYANVDLPSNSNKIVWLYGRIERPSITGFEVTFSGRGFAALTQRGDFQEPDEDQRVVAVVTNTDDGVASTLKSLKGQALFRSGTATGGPRINPNNQPVRALQFARDTVPDRWFGFEMADIVVLGDFPHNSLTPEQISSLKGYVQGGGNLVVLGGGNAARLSTSLLKDLWPVAAKSSGTATPAEVQGLVQRYVTNPKNGADRLGGAPVQVVRGPLKSAAILKDGTPEAPLFALLDNGAGRCLFLNYSPAEPPFTGWSGQGDLWKDVFDSCVKPRRLESVGADFLNAASGITPGYNSQYNGSFNNGGYNSYGYGDDDDADSNTPTGQLLKAIAKAPQLRMPPVSKIAWFLALYVFFLVPVNYAVLRFLDRRELAWITIPVIVLVFSIFAYSSAVSIRGRAILTRQVDVVQSTLGSWGGRDDSLLWLFSNRRRTYDIVSRGDSAAVSDFANKKGTEQGSFSVVEPGDGSSFKAESANIWMWTSRAFAAQSLVPLGKGVQLTGTTLRNNTPYDLSGAVWVQDQTVWSLGQLKKGASATIVPGKGDKFSGEIWGGIDRASHLDKVFDAFTNSNGIPAQVVATIASSSTGKLNGEAMLVAWSDKPVATLDVEGSQARNITMFMFRASKLPVALASTQATISRTAFEPFNSDSSSQAPNGYTPPGIGGYAFFNCVLPSQGKLTLRAHGKGIFKSRREAQRYGSYNPGATGAGAIVFEGKDARRNIWMPLGGTLRREGSEIGSWKYEAPIDRAWARQPDSLLQIRARQSTQQVQISEMTISNTKPAPSDSKAGQAKAPGAPPP